MEKWNSNEYQGRTKKQIESTEMIMATTLAVVIFITIIGLTIKILF